MELPIQSMPIQRATASRPFANRGLKTASLVSSPGASSAMGSDQGIDSSGWLDTIGDVLKVVGPPVLTGLGI
jgi:hypothetical protein